MMGNMQIRNGTLLGVLLVVLFISDYWLLRTTGWARLFGGLASYCGLALVYWQSPLQANDLGLGRASIPVGIRWSAIVVLLGMVVGVSAFLIAPDSFRDPRYNQPLIAAVITALVLVPLKTILFEELAFRGLLAGLLNALTGRWWAIIGSAIAFGLWHVPTALGAERSLRNNQVTLTTTGTLISVFVLTAMFGALLAYIRFRSRSLLVPIAIHWVLNGLGVILASLAWMR